MKKAASLCVPLSVSPASEAITSSTSHVAISKTDKCQAVSLSCRFTRTQFNSSLSLRASDLARLKAKCLLNFTEDFSAAGSDSLTPPWTWLTFRQVCLHPITRQLGLNIDIKKKQLSCSESRFMWLKSERYFYSLEKASLLAATHAVSDKRSSTRAVCAVCPAMCYLIGV